MASRIELSGRDRGARCWSIRRFAKALVLALDSPRQASSWHGLCRQRGGRKQRRGRPGGACAGAEHLKQQFAGLHGAGPPAVARRPAADRQRQARPPRALPAPDPALNRQAYEGPRSAAGAATGRGLARGAERRAGRPRRQLLRTGRRFDPVDRVVSRPPARHPLQPRDLFQTRPCRASPRWPGTARPARPSEGRCRASNALTPIQHWFFDLPLAPRDWNQSLLLQPRQALDLGLAQVPATPGRTA